MILTTHAHMCIHTDTHKCLMCLHCCNLLDDSARHTVNQSKRCSSVWVYETWPKQCLTPVCCVQLSTAPMDCSLPGFSAHGIFQARTLEWAIISSFRDLPKPGIKPTFHFLHWQAGSLPLMPPGEGSGHSVIVEWMKKKYTCVCV